MTGHAGLSILLAAGLITTGEAAAQTCGELARDGAEPCESRGFEGAIEPAPTLVDLILRDGFGTEGGGASQAPSLLIYYQVP